MFCSLMERLRSGRRLREKTKQDKKSARWKAAVCIQNDSINSKTALAYCSLFKSCLPPSPRLCWTEKGELKWENLFFISQYFLGKSQKVFNMRFHNSGFALLLLLKLQAVVALALAGVQY